jgi:hypothetical protein
VISSGSARLAFIAGAEEGGRWWRSHSLSSSAVCHLVLYSQLYESVLTTNGASEDVLQRHRVDGVALSPLFSAVVCHVPADGSLVIPLGRQV